MVLCVIQARMSSSRLPGKVLMKLGGVSLLERVHRSALRAKGIDKVVVATSTDTSDDILAEFCVNNCMEVFRGHLTDVLDRYYRCAEINGAETIIRLTADCPLIPTAEIERVVEAASQHGGEFVTNRPDAPDGWDCEAFSFRALQLTWERTHGAEHREHVTFAMKMEREFFPLRLEAPFLSVNTIEDFKRVEKYCEF